MNFHELHVLGYQGPFKDPILYYQCCWQYTCISSTKCCEELYSRHWGQHQAQMFPYSEETPVAALPHRKWQQQFLCQCSFQQPRGLGLDSPTEKETNVCSTSLQHLIIGIVSNQLKMFCSALTSGIERWRGMMTKMGSPILLRSYDGRSQVLKVPVQHCKRYTTVVWCGTTNANDWRPCTCASGCPILCQSMCGGWGGGLWVVQQGIGWGAEWAGFSVRVGKGGSWRQLLMPGSSFPSPAYMLRRTKYSSWPKKTIGSQAAYRAVSKTYFTYIKYIFRDIWLLPTIEYSTCSIGIAASHKLAGNICLWFKSGSIWVPPLTKELLPAGGFHHSTSNPC